jgi:hypothetical protein
VIGLGLALVAPLAGVALDRAPGAQETAPAAAAPQQVGVDDARGALDDALAWLVSSQKADGSWASAVLEGVLEYGFSVESFYDWKLASCALACQALLRAEETPARRAALARGLTGLVGARALKRPSDWDSDFVWGALYGAVTCVEAARDPRFADVPHVPHVPLGKEIETAGRRFVALLVANQTPFGGWAYYDDRPYSRRPKWDTSFCTALVLPTLADAEELGWLADPAVRARATRYVARCALPNGAYAYSLDPIPRFDGGEHIDDVKGSLSRIQVCNWGLARVGERKITPERLREGLAQLFEHHRFLDVARMRPYPHEAYYYNSGYFYLFGHYYAAEAIELLPAEEREALHARLRVHLLATQRPDGSAADFLTSGYELVACTAFLALGLQRGLP